jgi:hypothetical protein
MIPESRFHAIARTLKVAVATLRDANVPFVLGGSFAAWARGGPEPQNDLDFMVKPGDAEAALRALADAGMRTERPPEEWLYKAWDGDVMIDLIFRPAGMEMTDEVFERADMIAVLAVSTRVMALEDVLATKLAALDEHSLNYTAVLGIARALREQIDWNHLRARSGGSPYGAPFFTMVERLGIAPEAPGQHHTAARHVRVVTGGPAT